MLKLNRVSEYALISLAYIHRKQEERSDAHLAPGEKKKISQLSAREIAEVHHLPYEITAKTLQRLKKMGIIDSTQGVNGGYVLAKPLSSVSLAELLNGLEGEQSVVECAQHLRQDGEKECQFSTEKECDRTEAGSTCEFQQFCTLQPFMKMLNDRLLLLLEGIYLDEILRTDFSASGTKNGFVVNGIPALPLSAEMTDSISLGTRG